jgi:hypothetical protein
MVAGERSPLQEALRAGVSLSSELVQSLLPFSSSSGRGLAGGVTRPVRQLATRPCPRFQLANEVLPSRLVVVRSPCA